jgi:DNA-binding CsgD family transcriptional regulator
VLLRRLAVFDGWTVEAAESVCAGDGVARSDVVDLIGALVNKTLVSSERSGPRARYRLLNTVRFWAATKLHQAGEDAQVGQRHSAWCLEFAVAAEQGMDTGHLGPGRERLQAEHGNFAAACAWAQDHDPASAGKLAAALDTYWGRRRDAPEREDLPDWVRARKARAATPASAHAEAHHDPAGCNCNPMARMFLDPRQSFPDIEERMAFCRRTGDSKGLAHLFHTSGQAHFFLSEPSKARVHFEECVRLGREVGDDDILRAGLFGLARVSFFLGDLAAVKGSAGEARILAEAEGNDSDVATALAFLGDVARARGEWSSARDILDSALERAHAARSPLVVARTVYLLAQLDDWEGERDSAGIGERFAEALVLGRAAHGPAYHEVRCLLGMASARQASADLAAAEERVVAALEKAESVGDVQATAISFDVLAVIAGAKGHVHDASVLAHRGLELHHRIGDQMGVVASIELVAALAVDGGRQPFAARLFASAQSARAAHGYARSRRMQDVYDVGARTVRSGQGKTSGADWARNLVLPLDQAVVHALRGRGSRDRPASGWESLTPAERDVVRLVAEGLTNLEVGRRLFISRRTVEHHLTHVYDKLGVRSRHSLIRELAAGNDRSLAPPVSMTMPGKVH